MAPASLWGMPHMIFVKSFTPADFQKLNNKKLPMTQNTAMIFFSFRAKTSALSFSLLSNYTYVSKWYVLHITETKVTYIKHLKGCSRECFCPSVSSIQDFLQTPDLSPEGPNHNIYSAQRPLTIRQWDQF